ncbi:terpene cyclase/mutase family protein [Streptomyces sodiiphilus]|uniref:Terpene cyclase/mutase family protein n=1 Tax=Streptomyces sodiiphilus TaxID=226217 RepID=A0ABN2NX61_9ACTN
MNLRRSATALGGAALLVITAAPAVLAEDPPPAPEELYGEGDPSFDGVWRQSLALLAQDTSGYTPAPEAVEWLAGQQCEDGSFLSFRADTGVPCEDVTAADTNATALAVQALAAVGGQDEAVAAADEWLRSMQNEDGGWGYSPGGATDSNSTAVVIGALAAAGQDPDGVRRDDASPYEALAALQLGCEADQEERGAFAWQPDETTGDLFANPASTVDAVLAAYGSGLVVSPDVEGDPVPVSPLDCGDEDGDEDTPDTEGEDAEDSTEENGEDESGGREPTAGQSAAAGAAHLAALLAEGDNHLVSSLPGAEDQPDFGGTSKAVLALAAGGHGDAVRGPLEWLEANHTAWDGLESSPAALGQLVLAAHAGGADPADFGGTDLIGQLNALGPAPEQDEDGAADGAGEEENEEATGSGVLLWILGLGLLAGVVIGVLLTQRRKKRDS